MVLFVLVGCHSTQSTHSQLEFSINFITHDQTLYQKPYYVELVSTWWSDEEWIWKHIVLLCTWKDTLMVTGGARALRLLFTWCAHALCISVAELPQREFLFARERLSKHGVFSAPAPRGLGRLSINNMMTSFYFICAESGTELQGEMTRRWEKGWDCWRHNFCPLLCLESLACRLYGIFCR